GVAADFLKAPAAVRVGLLVPVKFPAPAAVASNAAAPVPVAVRSETAHVPLVPFSVSPPAPDAPWRMLSAIVPDASPEPPTMANALAPVPVMSNPLTVSPDASVTPAPALLPITGRSWGVRVSGLCPPTMRSYLSLRRVWLFLSVIPAFWPVLVPSPLNTYMKSPAADPVALSALASVLNGEPERPSCAPGAL